MANYNTNSLTAAVIALTTATVDFIFVRQAELKKTLLRN